MSLLLSRPDLSIDSWYQIVGSGNKHSLDYVGVIYFIKFFSPVTNPDSVESRGRVDENLRLVFRVGLGVCVLGDPKEPRVNLLVFWSNRNLEEGLDCEVLRFTNVSLTSCNNLDWFN